MKLVTLTAAAAVLVATFSAASAQSARRDQQFNDRSYYDRQCDSRRAGEQADCARAALAASDRELNSQYQRLLTQAQSADRYSGQRRERGWYSQEAALRSAQRAWIAMRDADCKFVTQPDIDRRRAPFTYTMCLVDRTDDRVGHLREMSDSMASNRQPRRS